MWEPSAIERPEAKGEQRGEVSFPSLYSRALWIEHVASVVLRALGTFIPAKQWGKHIVSTVLSGKAHRKRDREYGGSCSLALFDAHRFKKSRKRR